LHLKFRVRKIKAILEIFALPALSPRIHVNAQLAVSLSWPDCVDTDLKNPSDQRRPELESLQVWVNVAKASFHISLRPVRLKTNACSVDLAQGLQEGQAAHPGLARALR